MNNTREPGHFGREAPQYVYGRKNLDYHPSAAHSLRAASGDSLCAVSDFGRFRSQHSSAVAIECMTLDTPIRDIDFGDYHCQNSHNTIMEKYTIPREVIGGEVPRNMDIAIWKDDENTIHVTSDTIIDATDVVNSILDDYGDKPLDGDSQCSMEYAIQVFEDALVDHLDSQFMEAENGGVICLFDQYGEHGESVVSSYCVSVPEEYSHGYPRVEDMVDRHIDAYHDMVGDDIPGSVKKQVRNTIRKRRMGLHSI